MDPTLLIPSPDTIPVSRVWFELLLHITFVAHLLLMNTVVGGATIALISHLKGGSPALAKDLSTKLPVSLALTINLGVAPLLFLQVLYGNFFYTSSVLMAAWWLTVIAIVMAAYYGLYLYDFSFDSRPGARTLFIAAPLTLLLFNGFLFSNNMTLMLDPARWTDWFKNRGGTLLNLGDPSLLPRWLHFMVSALAVGGLAVALLSHLRGNREYTQTGLAWFIRSTMTQLLFGTWFLLSLPHPAILHFLGGDASSSLLLAGGLALTMAALFSAWRGNVSRALLWTVLTVAAMVLVRDRLRVFLLAPLSRYPHMASTGEYSPMILFLTVFLLAIPVVGWLIRQYLRAQES